MNVNSTNSTSYTNPYDMYKYYTRIGGLASGLDTDSIIQGLMSVEKTKYNKLYQQKQLLEWQRQDYMDMASAISSFKDYLFNLKLSSNFVKYKTSGEAVNSDYISVTGTANALEGNYQIDVKQLATSPVVIFSELKRKYNEAKQNSQTSISLGIEFSDGTSTPQSGTITINLDTSITESNFGSKLAEAINKQFGSAGLKAYYDSTLDKLILTTNKTGSNVSISINSVDLTPDNKVYSFVLDQNISNSNFTIKINNTTVDVNLDPTTLLDKDKVGHQIAIAINKNLANTGIKASYSAQDDKLYIVTSSSQNLDSSNTDLTLISSSAIGSGEYKAVGQDSVISIKDSFGNLSSYLNSSVNTFNLYGMSIGLKNITSGLKSFSISKDVDAIVNNVKEFINKYNELVSKIYSKITEKRNRDYLPLTEEQKSQMKDTDIQKWEEAAKKGLLYGDSILSSYLDNMRNYLYKQVSGLPYNLDTISEAGIETFSYFESKEGKIYIKDEAKLRDAIANNFDAFVKLFTNSGSDTTSIDDDGILQRFYNLANDTLKKIYDKAGKPYFTNTYDPNSSIGKQLRNIIDQMNAEQERLQKVEDRYYRQFTQLEQLIAQMNTQSSWLSQQFSGR